MRRAARAQIDLGALRHNFMRARACAPQSRIAAMVKADAYGHGLVDVASTLTECADALGVACIPEALALRDAGIPGRILVTQGFKHADELREAVRHGLDVVVHEPSQLACLERAALPVLPAIWLKLDTGMHRLGFLPSELPAAHAALMRLNGIAQPPGLLTHFACADEAAHPLTSVQLERFDAATARLPGERSMANSAAVLTLPSAHRDWVRPGIMLYGGSPLAHRSAAELDLHPVMSLRAPLIAINRRPRGESVGYGATFVCPEDMPIGIVAIGYGDGYPRHAENGTPVLLNGRRAALVGRVSMDMLAVDLRGVPARVGDEAVLWGVEELPVDEVARRAQTIGYELLCGAGSRNPRRYVGG